MYHREKQNDILSRFPKIKLCYENIIHHKVSKYDYCLAIPEGEKCFVWFRFEEKTDFYILCMNEEKNISRMKKFQTCFDDSLCARSGTILYGTLYLGEKYFFTIENVYYYKGEFTGNQSWYNKLVIMKNILQKDLNQTENEEIIFGLPYMNTNVSQLINQIKQIKYPIKVIEYRSEKTNVVQKTSVVDSQKYANFNQEKQIFKVKADIQNDIYYLYCLDNNQYVEYDYAYIPDYKTSVYMNKLFRNIKENANLDTLEESDDEDEFENEKEDRHVNLQKEYFMRCAYNHKFKKWTPLETVSNVKVVAYKELNYYQKK